MIEKLKGLERSIRDQTKDYIGSVTNWFKNRGSSSHNAPNDGYVSKSSTTSISESELIIPSELNPFYKGKTNKSSQREKESINYSN
jgi:hypothetical protein